MDHTEGQSTPPPQRAIPPEGSTSVELFEEAVRTNFGRLLVIARAIVGNRASPEDVVQQAVLNLFKHRSRYDWREPGGLLKRATVNEALRLLRQQKMSPVPEEVEADRMPSPHQEVVTDETVTKVREAIAKLPEHFRAALVLCEYENLSYAEIADTLKVSVPQVKTWIHRGRRRIEKMLAGYMDVADEDDDEGADS